MRTHYLKTLPDYWDAVASGEKTFEVRRDDRGFQKGDVLVLRKLEKTVTGGYRESYDNGFKELRRKIRYVLTGGQLGIEPGYVVLALAKA
jgi:ASC-1-like (ASCH) protein